MGQEDLGKLRKFLLVDQKIFGDVEDILERMQQPWLHSLQTSSIFLQTSSSLLHSHQFLLGQLLWLLCCLVLSLVVGAPRWQVFIFLVLCTVLQFWAVLLFLLLLCGYKFKIERNVSKEEYSHS